MEKRGKKAQAFLIAAVLLIGILMTFIAVFNSSKKTEFSTFKYIAEDINIESEKVMDYALLNNDADAIDKFTGNVSNYVGEDTRIYFIKEDKIYNYSGGSKTSNLFGTSLNTNDGLITATIDNIDYTFPLTQGKYFYFIMIKEDRGEKYVYTNA